MKKIDEDGKQEMVCQFIKKMREMEYEPWFIGQQLAYLIRSLDLAD